jgi:hypothetical protein
MPEELNVEVASTLAENAAIEADTEAQAERARWRERVEIIEAILLAAVAIATAWSGYQAARWDGRQAELYGHASTIRIQADEATTLGGQQRLLDVTTFNTWVEAKAAGEEELADLYERRFSPAYAVALDAWIAAGGLTNPNAPPGPGFMPQYENSLLERGRFLNDRATTVFEAGTEARGHADEYVRTTVVLATVLFLLALSQRFLIPKVRIGLLIVSGALMTYGLIAIALYPRF